MSDDPIRYGIAPANLRDKYRERTYTPPRHPLAGLRVDVPMPPTSTEKPPRARTPSWARPYLAALKNGPVRLSELAERLGVSWRKAQGSTSRLASLGLVCVGRNWAWLPNHTPPKEPGLPMPGSRPDRVLRKMPLGVPVGPDDFVLGDVDRMRLQQTMRWLEALGAVEETPAGWIRRVRLDADAGAGACWACEGAGTLCDGSPCLWC